MLSQQNRLINTLHLAESYIFLIKETSRVHVVMDKMWGTAYFWSIENERVQKAWFFSILRNLKAHSQA